MVNKVKGRGVASGGGSELAGEDSCPGRGAENTCGVGVGEVYTPFGQTVDIGGDGGWGGAVATDPVVHVVYRKEQDIWRGRVQRGCGNQGRD